ncbi:MAG: L-lactate dehydrogenase [Anaerolineae bacterium]|nr:L-lactate dehydrogenase [Anaerolineae bacterium]
MKVGIVGSGLVGSTAAYALVMRGIGREIVLVDLNEKRARAEAADIVHAVPFANPLRVRAGAYEDLAGCRVVILTAGVSQRPGETRLELLTRNAAVFRSVVPGVLAHAPGAVLVVATNPVDIMTHLAARYAAEHGVSSTRVVGSGTTLDTARFRTLLAQRVGVDSQHIHGYVLGEHGDSEVLAWSLVSVGAVPLEDFCGEGGLCIDDGVKKEIDDAVRNAAYTIIEGKGATYYGVGSALARIVEVILGDQRSVLTVCTPMAEVEGVKDVTLALPNLLGGEGVISHLPLLLSPEEHALLRKSAQVIRSAIDELGAS